MPVLQDLLRQMLPNWKWPEPEVVSSISQTRVPDAPASPDPREQFRHPFRTAESDAEELFFQAAIRGDPDAMFDYGVLAWEAGNGTHAGHWLRSAASRNHPEAMITYAKFIDAGRAPGALSRTDPALVEVQRWLVAAVEFDRTTAEAAFMLGAILHHYYGQLQAAVLLFYYSSRLGHVDATYWLAQLKTPPADQEYSSLGLENDRSPLDDTYPLERPYPRGHLAYLYKFAADAGHSDAAVELAQLYLRHGETQHIGPERQPKGEGRPADAELLLREASGRGHTKAMVLLAQILISSSKLDDARSLLETAAAKKDPQAMAYLARLLKWGTSAAPPISSASNFGDGRIVPHPMKKYIPSLPAANRQMIENASARLSPAVRRFLGEDT